MKTLTAPLLGLLIATPIMIAIGQVLFKMTSQRLNGDLAGPFYTVLIQPTFILALIIYGSATLVWIYVLKSVPLGYAYSFMALTFVIVPVLAAWWLGETLTIKYALGTTLIIAGMIVANS